MMSSRPRLLSALLLVSCLVLPLRADGDPIQIASGFLQVPGVFRTATFHFVGNDFDVSGALEPGVVGPDLTCFPCAAGDRVELSTSYRAATGSIAGTVDGTAFTGNPGGSIFFDARSFLAPSTVGDFTVTDTFAFRGNLIGFLNFNAPGETILFDKTLSGAGTVTARFRSTPNPGGSALFSFRDIRFDFASAGAVPEPATLLLLGTGVAGAFRWRQRRAE